MQAEDWGSIRLHMLDTCCQLGKISSQGSLEDEDRAFYSQLPGDTLRLHLVSAMGIRSLPVESMVPRRNKEDQTTFGLQRATHLHSHASAPSEKVMLPV